MREGTTHGVLWGSLLLVAFALTGLPSCQTRLVGQKTQDFEPLTPTGNGIPFRMSKPVFVIRKKYDEVKQPPTLKGYDLEVTYESDPQAVYWVQADPALFHSNTLTINFLATGHGVLQNLTSDSTDKSGDFITAIGTIAVAAVGISGIFEANNLAGKAGGVLALSGAALFAKQNNLFGSASPASTMRSYGTDKLLDDVLNDSDQTGMALFGAEWPTQRELLRTLATDESPLALLVGADLAPEARMLVGNGLLKKMREALQRIQKATKFTGLEGLVDQTWDEAWHKTLFAVLGKALAAAPPESRAAVDADIRLVIGVILLIAKLGMPTDNDWQKILVQLKWKEFEAARREEIEKGIVGHTKEYRDAESALFIALDLLDDLRQLRALEDFLDQVYLEFGSKGPKGKRLAEVLEARKQRAAIVSRAVEELGVFLEPVVPPSTEPIEPPPLTWVGDAANLNYPRWVRFTGRPDEDRAAWLKTYLTLNTYKPPTGPWPAAPYELVVLVERSSPEREVLPLPELRHFSMEISPCR